MAAPLHRLWTRARTWLLAYLPDLSRHRRPRVRIQTAAAVPGAGLRLAVVLIGLVCASTVVTGWPGWFVVIGLLVGTFCVPGSFVVGAFVIALGVLAVFDTTPAASWRTPLLVAGIPLMLQLASVAGQASWLAPIELRVIASSLRRYLVIQVFAQLLALVGSVVAGLGLVLPQVMALAAVALLALVLLWVPRLGPSRRTG